MNMSLFSVATESDSTQHAQVTFSSSSQQSTSSSIPVIQKSDPSNNNVNQLPDKHISVPDPFTPSPGLPTRKPRSRSNSQTALADGSSANAPRTGHNATVRSSNRRVLTHTGYSPSGEHNNINAISTEYNVPIDSSICLPCPLWERGGEEAGGGSGGISALTSGGKKKGGLEPPTIIQVDDTDLNPMKPCGACHEWLKKISEVNPRFSVITFTDVFCHGVYVEQIKD
jgi:hypothetical protein